MGVDRVLEGLVDGARVDQKLQVALEGWTAPGKVAAIKLQGKEAARR